MHDQSDILISVRGKFVDSMLSGTKRVELRRRAPRIGVATRIWIYNKTPLAAVRAMATLGAIETLHSDELWRKYSSVLDLTFREFEEYVAGRDKVSALCLHDIRALRPVSLETMRQIDPKFHPPQFYLRLNQSSSLLDMLEESLIQR